MPVPLGSIRLTDRIKKAGRHVSQNEGLIFEESAPGKRGVRAASARRARRGRADRAGRGLRSRGIEGFPEVSEIEVIRHFTRLSTWNYAIDLGMYPLGSCTMKYNPRVNEFVARLDGIATEHPYQPQELSQGCLKILQLLLDCLAEITGMDTGTLRAGGGRAGRTHRPAADSRLPRRHAGTPAQKSFDSRLRARHQSRDRGDCRIRRGKRALG